jgi:hypothetical protein
VQLVDAERLLAALDKFGQERGLHIPMRIEDFPRKKRRFIDLLICLLGAGLALGQVVEFAVHGRFSGKTFSEGVGIAVLSFAFFVIDRLF